MSDQLEKKVQGLNLKDKKFNFDAMEFVPSWESSSEEQQPIPAPAAPFEPNSAKVMSIGGGAAKLVSIGGKSASSATGTTATKKSVDGKSSASSSKPSSPPPPSNELTSSGTRSPSPDRQRGKSDQPASLCTTNDANNASGSTKNEADAALAVAAANQVDEDVTFDVTELGKEHLNIIFIGHVDAGKSTMGGHILYLTGMVDKRTMEKYEKEAKELGRESWYLSWALDLNTEERAKGKTTEYGRGYFETEKRKFTIIDAPGHKNFVPSMIEGAAQADVGILVISGRRGEFEAGFEKGGQTREHAMLAKTAGVKHLIMVINKMDEPSVQWSQERYDECVNKILPFLKSVGYDQKRDLDIMPISGFTGANMKDRLDSAVCPWYQGPSLLERLDNLELGRSYTGPLLMPIADKFKEMGTIVMGKVESGRVKKGQSVMIMPNKKVAEVLAIFIEDSEIPLAKCGDNVRMRLKNVEEEDVLAGFVICGFKNPVHCVTAFVAQLKIIEYKSIMCAGYTAVMHAHTVSEEIILSELLHMIDKKTGRRSKNAPKFVRQGDACIVKIECQQTVCLETYADYQQLGRFTLRDEGKTVAIGKVVKLLS